MILSVSPRCLKPSMTPVAFRMQNDKPSSPHACRAPRGLARPRPPACPRVLPNTLRPSSALWATPSLPAPALLANSSSSFVLAHDHPLIPKPRSPFRPIALFLVCIDGSTLLCASQHGLTYAKERWAPRLWGFRAAIPQCGPGAAWEGSPGSLVARQVLGLSPRPRWGAPGWAHGGSLSRAPGCCAH